MKDEALKLAKECGATTYTNRHYPEATAVTFSPLAWETFCEQALAAQPAPVQEPIAWRFTGVAGFKRYVTDAQHKAFSPEVQSWYEPFKCSGCAAAPAQPATEIEGVKLMQMLDALIQKYSDQLYDGKGAKAANDFELDVAAIRLTVEAQPAVQKDKWVGTVVDSGHGYKVIMFSVDTLTDIPHGTRCYIAAPAAPEVCCGEYATCLKPCTPRGEFLASQKVPDAINDNREGPEYRAGWNECRQAMMEMMK
jgi:hypothetical protein